MTDPADTARDAFYRGSGTGPSRTAIEHSDEPRTISEAEFQAHLVAHRQLEERLLARDSRSDPVTMRTRWGSIQAKGSYLIVLASLALVAFWLWLRER